MRGPAWWRVLGWSSSGGAGGRPLHPLHPLSSLRAQIQVWRLHLQTGGGSVTNQRVELEVVVGRVGQDDVGQARLEGNNWGWGWLAVGLAGGLGVAGLVTELVNLKQNIIINSSTRQV